MHRPPLWPLAGILLACVACASPVLSGPVNGSVHVAGGEVHYLDHGAGPVTLVLVHGWGGDHRVWHHQLTGLAADARLLAVDLPGHGGSDAPTGPITMAGLADSVVAVLDDAGVERAVVVGHSNGAAVALTVLRRHPGRTAGLVALEGALRDVFPDPDQQQAWLDTFRGPDATDNAAEYLESILGTLEDPAARTLVLDAVRGVPPPVLVGSLEAAFDPAVWSDDPIDVPLLSVLAESPFWDAEYQAFVRRLAPGVDWQVIPDSGHWVMLEYPDEVNDRVRAWLNNESERLSR